MCRGFCVLLGDWPFGNCPVKYDIIDKNLRCKKCDSSADPHKMVICDGCKAGYHWNCNVLMHKLCRIKE